MSANLVIFTYFALSILYNLYSGLSLAHSVAFSYVHSYHMQSYCSLPAIYHKTYIKYPSNLKFNCFTLTFIFFFREIENYLLFVLPPLYSDWLSIISNEVLWSRVNFMIYVVCILAINILACWIDV